MTKQYEATRRTGLEPLTLVFPAGDYEALPFEVRLMGPWYGSIPVNERNLKPAQRYEISRQGYTVIRDMSGFMLDAA
ncbi:MAG: hypothetical protein HC850_02665 [Rhodomicrobium sp.]|nr:hypothetical protein [Rhodomicrobium sp.]